eukprot:GHVS01095169.1.p1 GENE.GHVS01095169.1~~GHVS01095169.1.p1  ORF type:complete len:111 (+),score=2.10 GHVS01095169.1:75-407(+)
MYTLYVVLHFQQTVLIVSDVGLVGPVRHPAGRPLALIAFLLGTAPKLGLCTAVESTCSWTSRTIIHTNTNKRTALYTHIYKQAHSTIHTNTNKRKSLEAASYTEALPSIP